MSEYEFDVCLSFAGEQREYVADVANLLRGRNVKIFYDEYEEAGLWGKDLYEHLDSVYRTRSRFCILFASTDYASKVWTTHERRSAQARAFQDSEEYILPARFDDTEIPGLRPTVGYVDLRTISPHQLADLVVRKLATTRNTPSRLDVEPEYSTTPTTSEERARIISLKPSAWELYLFAGIILQGKNELRPKRQDYEVGYATPVRRLNEDEDVVRYLWDRIAAAQRLNRNLMALLDEHVQVQAFGRTGEPGDVERIQHLVGQQHLGDLCW
jgi:hypothetical protein